MSTAGAVRHFYVNLQSVKCSVINVLPNPVVDIGGHGFEKHSAFQCTDHLDHLPDVETHAAARFHSPSGECLSSQPDYLSLDHRQVVMGCALFHKKPKPCP